MKKIFLLLVFLGAARLYSQGANYPYIMNNGTILINTGVGFGQGIKTATLCPPITASMDIAIPILNLPMTLGFTAGYLSEYGNGIQLSGYIAAGRIGYHFNIANLNRLDVYALVDIGAIITDVNSNINGVFLIGVLAGARYFFLPYLGAYVEFGFDTVQYVSFGFSFRL